MPAGPPCSTWPRRPRPTVTARRARPPTPCASAPAADHRAAALAAGGHGDRRAGALGRAAPALRLRAADPQHPSPPGAAAGLTQVRRARNGCCNSLLLPRRPGDLPRSGQRPPRYRVRHHRVAGIGGRGRVADRCGDAGQCRGHHRRHLLHAVTGQCGRTPGGAVAEQETSPVRAAPSAVAKTVSRRTLTGSDLDGWELHRHLTGAERIQRSHDALDLPVERRSRASSRDRGRRRWRRWRWVPTQAGRSARGRRTPSTRPRSSRWPTTGAGNGRRKTRNRGRLRRDGLLPA